MKANVAPVLSLDNVTKSFGSKVAVSKLSININKGEVFGFLGPNGAGKTTTIRVILDVLRPNEGSVKLFGCNNRLTKITHRRIGYLSGDMVLDGDLTGAQYLSFVNYTYGSGNEERIQKLAKLLTIGLNTKIDSYSRGNRQKIALIGALSHEPELLILDEPTSGFDPLVQEMFIDLIKKYQARGGTVFMSSHILNEVQRLCSRVAFIKDGSLIDIKDIEELKKDSTRIINIIAKPNEISSIKARCKSLPGLRSEDSAESSITLTYHGDISRLLRFAADFQIIDITITEPDLEDAFVSYYKDKDLRK